MDGSYMNKILNVVKHQLEYFIVMEPTSQEKYLALCEHVETLTVHLERLRLKCDLCEEEEQRRFLENEIEQLVLTLDPLLCEKMVFEENVKETYPTPEKKYKPPKIQRTTAPKDGELRESWIGKFLEKEGSVYILKKKLRTCNQWHLEQVERSETGEKVYVFDEGKNGWKLSSFRKRSAKFSSKEGGEKLCESWIGRVVEKEGKLYILTERIPSCHQWELEEFVGENGCRTVRFHEGSTGWKLSEKDLF
ncbi:hypothetical protein GMAR_ORF102 [Golden Marseillevirus]|uniref:hypothetical protein n=1 Tax=Golden Marseillevirus TaxID=1720526 RepID=UPI000877ADF1|nr:hypothetical protein GMAR_ORF102 [Golden Marseillevirus]ALX27476.1 hypothetical protein GMAR_ORF102 [Golden Marseillevirus]